MKVLLYFIAFVACLTALKLVADGNTDSVDVPVVAIPIIVGAVFLILGLIVPGHSAER
ncbi:MAG TPA: hypothetical protein VK694_06725 [Verrucomicrobiae bacterium]|nr:hypothetical protein [Verrucomicrobiae bacterium]